MVILFLLAALLCLLWHKRTKRAQYIFDYGHFWQHICALVRGDTAEPANQDVAPVDQVGAERGDAGLKPGVFGAELGYFRIGGARNSCRVVAANALIPVCRKFGGFQFVNLVFVAHSSSRQHLSASYSVE
jgi:hypothetical protein